MPLEKIKMKLRSFKFIFQLFIPNKNKILIFDKEGSDDLDKYVLSDIQNNKVYDLEIITIYFNIKFIIKFLKNIFYTHVNDCSFIKKFILFI